MYMLDTNICIYVIKQRPVDVLDRFNAALDDGLSISVVTYAELQYGVERSSSKRLNQSILDDFVSRLAILAWDKNAAKLYAGIRATLEKKGKIIGNMDMLIAAHAGSRDCTLVTNNLREFKRIRGLKCENWI
ncbi:MAG: type II toxin-antitoxin system VapC family toxin [Proteobacteria bacterium]|nr:type II toxin-antitoxin system VapC family toxin [Pseudomonadota bacterium]